MTITTLLKALAVAALVALAGCQLGDPTIGGTVVNVTEAQASEHVEPAPKYYEDPLVPEVAWQVDVRLDNGNTATVIHKGSRRYAPGERVRLLRDEDGALLL
jgi:outer membrane lipoprotein SlyB